MPENGYIYVWAPDGRPLMPTKRHRHVKKLLNKGKARIACHVPYTIQLLYDTPGITQPVSAGIDPGRTNTAIAGVSFDGEPLFLAECTTRNREIRKLMDNRRRHRRASRSGERKARQRLAKRFHTMIAAGCKMRHLPCYGEEKHVVCKYIRNTEARFCNRKRKENWVTPTVRQLIQTHINLVKQLQKYLPVTDVTLEINRFAFALLENPNLKGLDFQNGPLKGFNSKEAAVYEQQNGRCLLCGKLVIEHYHHLRPRHEGGSNTLENLAGLCKDCHTKVHTDPEAKKQLADIKQGIMQKYGALSALNQAIPFIAEQLLVMFPEGHIHFLTGYETKQCRERLGFSQKTRENPLHVEDSYCIALSAMGKSPETIPNFGHVYDIRQFRRHDRALIQSQFERTYYYEGKAVAKNRRPRFEQKGDALCQWYEKQVQKYGRETADTMRSRLTVKKSRRSYNNPKRLMPGTVFLYKGKRYVMRGQQNGGNRLFGMEMQKSVDIQKCQILKKNTGLVFCS